MISDYEKIKMMKQYILDNNSISIDKLRKQFGLTYNESREFLLFLVKNKELKRSNLGFAPLNLDVNTISVADVDNNHIEEVDKKWLCSVYRENKRLKDTNRQLQILNKSMSYELDSKVSMLDALKANVEVLNYDFKLDPTVLKNYNQTAIIQLSDLHLNKIIEGYQVKDTNIYNWDIASQRLQKYAQHIKRYLNFNNITNVFVAFTGDIFNADRLHDQLRSNSDSGMVALFIATDILSKFIIDIVDFKRNVKVYSVFGNESRLLKDYTSIEWEHNLDYGIHKTLEIRLANYSHIKFEQPVLDHSLVVSELGANLLFWHGHNKTDINTEIEKYTADPVIKNRRIIDYSFSGHWHTTKIEGKHSRSASLAGTDPYAYHMLGYHSASEQNFHILTKECDGRVPTKQTIVVNLDYTDDFKGYEYNREELYRRDRSFTSK